jgi:hypothetical protein
MVVDAGLVQIRSAEVVVIFEVPGPAGARQLVGVQIKVDPPGGNTVALHVTLLVFEVPGVVAVQLVVDVRLL